MTFKAGAQRLFFDEDFMEDLAIEIYSTIKNYFDEEKNKELLECCTQGLIIEYRIKNFKDFKNYKFQFLNYNCNV